MMLTPRLERTIEVPFKGGKRLESRKLIVWSPKKRQYVKYKDVRCPLLNNGEFGLKWLVPGGYIGEPMVF
jgi:hypothetical protein